MTPSPPENLAGVARIITALTLSPALRGWYTRWGATPHEVRQPLPGDKLVPLPRLEANRAVTIHAPASVVWGWLVQMGHGRGGLYSYDGLENLAGCDLHSADSLHEEWQSLAVGDKVRLGPPGYPAYQVAVVKPERALVLVGVNPKTETPDFMQTPLPRHYVVAVWTFALTPLDEQTTRLLVRTREDFAPTLLNRLIWRWLTEPIHFVMERKMLLGIKRRAESTR